MFTYILTLHIAAGLISVIATPAYFLHKSGNSKWLAIISIGMTTFSGVGLIFLGGSLAHVCISLGIYSLGLALIARRARKAAASIRRKSNVLD